MKKRARVSTSLPVGAMTIIDSAVGTLYGETRAAVLRFIVTSWFTADNFKALDAARAHRAEYDRKQQEKKHAHDGDSRSVRTPHAVVGTR